MVHPKIVQSRPDFIFQGPEMPRKPPTTVQFKLRLPANLAGQIKRLTTKSGRTLNAEIVQLLEIAVMADSLGLGGIEGLIKAAQGASAMSAVREVMKEYGLERGAVLTDQNRQPSKRKP